MNRSAPGRRTLLAAAVIAAWSGGVQAQQAQAVPPAPSAQPAEPAPARPAGQLEAVTIVGQGASLRNALEQQREADQIENVVHADGVSQLPDDNAAEALQRLPGVSVERDQGEGRFVTVRGMGADLNTVTINGTLIPAPETDRRAVALDVLPSELIQSLSVVKTLTPDMDANSLGGTIEVESLSAFDTEEPLRTLSVEGGYDDYTGKTSPKFSGAVTQKFSVGGGTDNLGIAAAFSWQRRDFGSENVETGGGWDFDDGARMEETAHRDYRIRRERRGLGLNFDFRPDAVSSYYLRTLQSRYQDNETRNAAVVEFEDPVAAGERGTGEGMRELKHRTETQRVGSVVLGGERMMGMWTVSGQAGYSRSEEESPGGIAGAEFAGIDDFAGAGFSGTRKPVPRMPASFYDARSFMLDSVEWEEGKTTDTEKNIRLDLARDYDVAGMAGQVKFGGKLSRRVKRADQQTWIYEDFGDYGIGDDRLNMAGYATGSIRNGLGRVGPGISHRAVQDLIGGLNRDDFFDEEESRVNDFRIDEDINAAYVMNTLDVRAWRLIAGLRYEGTRRKAAGTGIEDGEFVPIERKNDDDQWLPGLHARYSLSDATQLRAAWTNTVVRPTFGELAPGFVIEDDEASFGNPDLKPLKSMNLDLGVEHYFSRSGVASAYVFYKDIKDFVYATDLAGTGDWAAFSQAETYANGDRARLYGLELAYQQKLDWLPSPWNGLILGANVTMSRSEAHVAGMADGRSMRRRIDLPNQSDTVGNLMVGWENDSVSVRLAANYKSKYLAEVAGIDDPGHDLYADGQLFLDLSARYKVNKNLQFYFQAQNLTDESYYVYTGSKRYNAQYESYGPTYKLGMTLLF